MRIWYAVLYTVLGFACLIAGPTDLLAQEPQQYVLDGFVRDITTGTPLHEAEVTIRGVPGVAHAHTTPTGRFHLAITSPGTVDLVVRRIGYHPQAFTGIAVPLEAPLDIQLTSIDAVPLADLFARGSRSTDLASSLDHVLTGEDVKTRSFLGEDAYRTLTRMPGVTADEMSARFRMRGAEQEEVLVRLDGLTLLDPFHLKDVSGTFSVVDGYWVERTVVRSAGFGAQYGDRTAGVVEFSTADPGQGGRSIHLSASPTHVRAASVGAFGGGRGGWLVTARRGIPEVVIPAIGGAAEFSPGYFDGMAKVTISPARDHLVSAHLLVGADRFDALMDNGGVVSQSRSHRTYSWLRWRAGWTRNLRTETVLSGTAITPERDVAFNPNYPEGVTDRRAMTDFAARHDLDWTTNGVFGFRAGAEVHQASARYDYAFKAPIKNIAFDGTVHSDTNSTFIEHNGTNLAAYLAPRARLGDRLEVEAGLRYDYASQTGRPRFGPRVRGRLNVARQLSLLGSWGLYSQAKGLHELDVVNGERSWALQRAMQTTAGLEWHPGAGIRTQVEAYRRIVNEPWSRQLNIELGFEVVPEVDDDDLLLVPVRSRADGVDVEVAGPLTGRANWRVSYTLSRAEDFVEGIWVPRTYDQRHAASIDATWRLGERWSLAGAWQWHSGWPVAEPNFTNYTLQGGRVIPSYDYRDLGNSRMSSYNRLDLRIRRDLALAGGTLGVSLDVVNVLNRRNVRGVSYDGILQRDGTVIINRNPLVMAPLVPVVGLSWTR